MEIEGIQIYTFDSVIREIVNNGKKVLYLTTDSVSTSALPRFDLDKFDFDKAKFSVMSELFIAQSPKPHNGRNVTIDADKGIFTYTIREIAEEEVVTILEENDLAGMYDMVVQKLGERTVIVYPNPATNIIVEIRKQISQPMGARTGRMGTHVKPRPSISEDIETLDTNKAKRQATNFMIQAMESDKRATLEVMYGQQLVSTYRALTELGKNVLHLTSSYETKSILSKWLSLHANAKGIGEISSEDILYNLRNDGQTDLISRTRRDLFTYNNYGRLDIELFDKSVETLDQLVEGFENDWRFSDHQRDGDTFKYDVIMFDDIIAKVNYQY